MCVSSSQAEPISTESDGIERRRAPRLLTDVMHS